MYSTIYPSTLWCSFLPYFLLQLFKIMKILCRGVKIPFSSICYEHKTIYEQTALVMQIRIDTHRTLFMQDLGSHSSSEDQSSEMLCPIAQWTAINIFKVPPWDGSEVGKEIFSTIFVKLLGKICCKCHNTIFQH